MIIKLIGALLVVASCGGFGISIASGYKKEVLALKKLITSVDRMVGELEYRLTPLPELLRLAGKTSEGPVGTFFLRVVKELNRQLSTNAQDCFTLALSETYDVPNISRSLLEEMGTWIGQYDAETQIKGLLAIKQQAENHLSEFTRDMDKRLRSYQTLGLCAGAAIAILFV